VLFWGVFSFFPNFSLFGSMGLGCPEGVIYGPGLPGGLFLGGVCLVSWGHTPVLVGILGFFSVLGSFLGSFLVVFDPYPGGGRGGVENPYFSGLKGSGT